MSTTKPQDVTDQIIYRTGRTDGDRIGEVVVANVRINNPSAQGWFPCVCRFVDADGLYPARLETMVLFADSADPAVNRRRAIDCADKEAGIEAAETDPLAWLTEEPVSDLERRVAADEAARQAREAADPHAVEALQRSIRRAAEKRDMLLDELQCYRQGGSLHEAHRRRVSSLDETLMGLHVLLAEARDEEAGAMFEPAYHAEQMAERR